MNLELKDDDAVPIDLNGDTSNLYSFIMEVRLSDRSETIVLSPTPTLSLNTTGLVTFSVPATDMDVESGLYVYDIQQTRKDGATTLSVETLVYGTFKINEDVTV